MTSWRVATSICDLMQSLAILTIWLMVRYD